MATRFFQHGRYHLLMQCNRIDIDTASPPETGGGTRYPEPAVNCIRLQAAGRQQPRPT